MEIGTAIKLLRKTNNIPQRNLYHNFCSRKQISRIENNKSTPSLEMLIHICCVLNTSVDSIIDLAKMIENNEFNTCNEKQIIINV
ncbi:hypothetical protein IGI96_003715 [Enterococcus sp. DIV0421]|uniref:helix-turn-helix domain-containing protein n=1 Tax=Enterococcus sp. DIV0421 TaxID=2774688 RepID=UPI003F22AB01